MKVILIDDNPTDHFIHKKLVRKAGFTGEILSFDSVAKASQYFSTITSELTENIIFLDLNMPVQNGFDFLDFFTTLPLNVRSQNRVYILSSSANNSDLIKSAQYTDLKGYLQKPLSAMQVSHLLEYSSEKQAAV